MTKKRDQRPYDLVQQYTPLLILDIVYRIVNELGNPYEVKAGLGGMKAYPPKAMAMVCIIMEFEHKTYRRMNGYLIANAEMVRKLGLSAVPSKSTMARSYSLIPESYLQQIHERVVRYAIGDLAGDSTGYSGDRFSRWFDVRTNLTSLRKEWIKLHVIISIKSRVIITFLVTDSNVADINGLRTMLTRFSSRSGNFCLDSAYLARDICDIISKIGMVPFIKPKSNTISNARGSTSWAKMIRMYVDTPDTFNTKYHQRSIVESVFGALKKMHGDRLRCRRKDNQHKELAIRVICYNIEVVARSDVMNDRLTRESLAAIAARR